MQYKDSVKILLNRVYLAVNMRSCDCVRGACVV